jgi:DNA-directed RNA polymerase subunit RPC12/RpoP
VIYNEGVDYDSLEQHTYEDSGDYVFYTCPNCGKEQLATVIIEEDGMVMCLECWGELDYDDEDPNYSDL